MPIDVESQRSKTGESGEIDITSLSPELINQITELVYGLLMDELRIDFERTHFSLPSKKPGGW